MGRKRRRAPPPSFMTSLPHRGFIQMFNDQFDSPAFICLSPVAKVMYLILRQQYKGDYTGNDIICPYSTFIEKGISRNSIPENLRMLKAMGFITWESGGLYHTPNLYHFIDDWKNIRSAEEGKLIRKKLAEEKKENKQVHKSMAGDKE